jgi:hypothetical protein
LALELLNEPPREEESKMRMTQMLGCSLIAPVVLGIAACGSAPSPARSQAEALAVIRSAEAVGAQKTPQGAYHLELARQNFERAQIFIAAGDMEEARGTLARAKADAELAISISEQEEIREQAEQSRERLEALEREREEESIR